MKFKSLRKRKKKPVKIKFATFDIEAEDWINFKILGFYDGEEYKEFYNLKSFLNYVLRSKYQGYNIYAHFGGRYDFLFLLEELYNKAQIIEVNGRIIELKIYLDDKHKKVIKFRDSFSLLPVSLERLTKTFNVEHKKLDNENFDFSNLKIDKNLREYLKNDVIGLYEVLEKFQDQINELGGEIKLTLAATSLDLFQRKYMKKDWMFPTYFEFEDEIRASYFGGRCEVFKKYGKNLNYYDFNSLYPSVMKDNKFPVGRPIRLKKYKFNPNDTGFCYIETYIPKSMDIPLLPVHEDGMMIFRTGKIKGWYSIPLLKRLNDIGIKFKVKEAILFQGKKIFNDFVDDLYRLRKENKNNSLNLIAKLLMNSLYGKFAQKVKRKNYIINPKKEDFEKYKLINYNEKLDIWYYETKNESNYILPAISSYVTSYAMLKLYDILISCDPYYCDTDSIITEMKIENSDELGKLKLEDEIDEGIFLSQKLYAYKNKNGKEKIVAKGFPIEELKFSDYEKALFYKDYSGFIKKRYCMFGFREALKRFDKFLHYGEKKKSLKTIDTKRKFSKFKSSPLHFE
ncbi:MAG: DNA polymerase [Promethearchaeota archaeon]